MQFWSRSNASILTPESYQKGSSNLNDACAMLQMIPVIRTRVQEVAPVVRLTSLTRTARTMSAIVIWAVGEDAKIVAHLEQADGVWVIETNLRMFFIIFFSSSSGVIFTLCHRFFNVYWNNHVTRHSKVLVDVSRREKQTKIRTTQQADRTRTLLVSLAHYYRPRTA